MLDKAVDVVENNSQQPASDSIRVASQQPVTPEVTMATLPAKETLSRAAAQSADRGNAPVAGLEMAVAAAAILLWIVLSIN